MGRWREDQDFAESTGAEVCDVAMALVRYGGPTMAGLLVGRIYLLIEGVYVSHAGDGSAFAALTLAAPVVAVLNAVAALVGDGAGTVAALALGRGDVGRAACAVGNAVVLLGITAFALACGIGAAMGLVLDVLGATEATQSPSSVYLGILLAGMVPRGFANGLVTIFRAAGFPGRTLFVQILTSTVSAMVGAALVLGLKCGVAGAAVATVTGQGAAMVAIIMLFRRSSLPFRLSLTDFAPSRSVMGDLVALGMPTFVLRLSDALIAGVATLIVSRYGALTPLGADSALAALGVVDRLGQFTAVVSLGVAVGARPLIGLNFGAARFERVVLVTREALVAATVGLTIMWATIEFGCDALAGAFGLTDAEADFTEQAVALAMMALPAVGVRQVGTNFFQGCGRARMANLLAASQRLLVVLPLMVAVPALVWRLMGAPSALALFAAMALGDVGGSLLVGGFLAVALRRLSCR